MTFIIILNWKNWKDTIECIESVLRSDCDAYRIILVDNHSDDGSLDCIIKYLKGELAPYIPESSPLRDKSYPPKTSGIPHIVFSEHDSLTLHQRINPLQNELIVIKNAKNYGFGAGNNVGIRCALTFPECSTIWLLNNDTVIDSDALRQLDMLMEHDYGIGIIGSALRYYDHPHVLQAMGGGRFYPLLGLARLFKKNEMIDDVKTSDDDFSEHINYVMGASLLLRRTMLDQIGIFDERYFLFTEEVDLCHRAQNAGWKMAVCKHCSVYHKDSSSTKDQQHLYYYLLCKSNLLFVLKFYGIFYTLVAIPSLFLNTTRLTQNPRNIIAALKGMLAAFSNNHPAFPVNSRDLSVR